MNKIPKEFQPILWSVNVKNLDLEKDKNYIIHQLLMYGNFKQIKWLFRVYSKEEIKEVFLNCPKRIYTPAVFEFIKKIILGLGGKKLKKERYVKSSF